MQVLLRILAVIASILLVISLFTIVLFRPWGTQALRAGLYKEVLVGERIYERVPELIGENVRAHAERAASAVATDADGGESPVDPLGEIARALGPRDWDTLIGGVAPPEVLRTEIESMFDQMERFLHGETLTPTVTISLVEMKRRMLGNEAVEAYAAVLATKPPCTEEQWTQSSGLPIACQPSPDHMAGALENFRAAVGQIAESMPDEVDLLEDFNELDGPEGAIVELAPLRRVLRLTEWIARWSPVVPVVLALLIVLLVVRTPRGLLLWWGIPCLIAGAFGGLVEGAMTGFVVGMMNGIAAGNLPPEAPVATIGAIGDVVAGVVNQLMLQSLLVSVVLGVAGLVAVIVASVACRKSASPPPAPQAA